MQKFINITKTSQINLQKLPKFNFSSSGNQTAAIILSGCGVYDGTEITEAVSLFIALNQNNIKFQCYAPNINQHHVINHTNGNEQEVTRNVLEESARIARGNVKDLETLDQQNYNYLFIPGGFGAAKNLSTFAFKGADMTVESRIQKVLDEFHQNGKIIGACCISPMILAKHFQNKQPTLTLGQAEGDQWPYAGSIEAAKSLGANTEAKNIDQVSVDVQNKLVTAPAFMYEGSFLEISQSVANMVNAAVELNQK